ncbi:hypothetical protein M422DRAFT_782831 [Sphaerobolus stellatus SS14]|uniref:FUN14 domain-containing protein n=1 Tax=Sphaerobolus stellatus (strain SS14) TaxID=990650 RepID=A0A0C9UZF4_SPHS4|nr:hypothetical protein M422DRAFT_782831 [Sphaerobolus stellatus SS14]
MSTLFSRSICSRPNLFRSAFTKPFNASFSLYRPGAQQAKTGLAAQITRNPAGGRDFRWLSVAGGVGLGLSMSLLGETVICDPTTPPASRPTTPVGAAAAGNPVSTESVPAPEKPLPPPPESILNLYELSFGTVAGICAGVFVKKGAKAVAFFVGGVFVLLQYFNSMSLVRVDWARMGTKFENLFYTKGPDGVKKAPTIGSLFRWLVDFLAADFQPRASFIAGLMLGLRIG